MQIGSLTLHHRIRFPRSHPLTQAVLTSNSLDNSQILFNFADNLANLKGTAFHF